MIPFTIQANSSTTDQDLDMGGSAVQLQRQYLGPSIGWTDVPNQNVMTITTGGTYAIPLGVTLVRVASNLSVTLILPTMSQPPLGSGSQPAAFALVPITIVDIAGTAGPLPIAITSTLANAIMGMSVVFISVNYGAYVFWPIQNAPPVITSITPPSGPSGTLVAIAGYNFTGVTSVTIGGVAAAFTILSDTLITATVP